MGKAEPAKAAVPADDDESLLSLLAAGLRLQSGDEIDIGTTHVVFGGSVAWM